MVLAERVGRKRSFAAGLLLTIATFGVYAVYWNYRAHNELYRQFELQREGRDEGMVWYVLGLVVPPFLLAYLYIFGNNLAYLRERMGLARRTTGGRIVTLVGLGVGAFAVGLLLLQVALTAQGGEESQAQIDAAIDQWGVTFLGLSLAAAILLAIAYRMMQRDANEVWDAWAQRMAYLSAHPEATYAPAPPPVALAAAPAAATPAALADEWARLRAEHPELQAAQRLDESLARSSWDEAARAEAERLLRDVEALLDERRGLLARRVDAPDDERARIDERLAVVETALFGE